MAKIKIDGTEIDVAPEAMLLQACEAAGAEVPRFCFRAGAERPLLAAE